MIDEAFLDRCHHDHHIIIIIMIITPIIIILTTSTTTTQSQSQCLMIEPLDDIVELLVSADTHDLR
jgi:hypothetical protein